MDYFDKSYFDGNNSFLIISSISNVFFIKDILHNLNVNYGYIFTKSLAYDTLIHDCYRFKNFEKEMISEYKQLQSKNGCKSILIFDNDTKILKLSYIKDLLNDYQNYNTSFIFTMNAIYDFDIKKITYHLILMEKDYIKRAKIFKIFIHIFKTFNKFNIIMDTLNYRTAIIIYNDSFKIYKAYMHYAKPLFLK